MRKIKFRVWNKTYKEYVRKHDGCSDYSFIQYKDGSFSLFGVSAECLVIQQFTGLLDKNGKEIYEGDIVEFISRSDINGLHSQTGRIMDVQFNNGMFYPLPTETAVGDNRYWICKQDYKIIGNIFENPDLLKS